ncbi:MAG: enoyl-CoA hydratase/isomerase family protein [Phycisphaerales bacterium]|nr:enoyl-CoA hydratase/isomerase family protein [Phycisphaerales bacterium]
MNQLLIEHDAGLTVVTLNNPDQRNALSVELLQQMARALDPATDDEPHAILLRGNGPAFCAGFDLGAVVDDPCVLQDLIVALGEVTHRMRNHPAPIVLAAHGSVIAGGCAILSAADIVILGDQTKVGYPVHRLGVSPAVTLPTLLQTIGEGPARAIVMDGRLRTGMEAHRLGIGTQLVPEDDVQKEALELACSIASQPSAATAATKKWMNALDGSDDGARWDGPIAGSKPLAEGAEAAERIQAFWANRRS